MESEIVMVIDRSGSMFLIKADAIGGFNEFLATQKRDNPGAHMSLVEFNNKVSPYFTSKPVPEVYPMTDNSYRPFGGTALLDGIGQTIDSLKNRFAGKRVLVVIMTDGAENSSESYTREAIKEMITERSAAGWEFLFLGADQDAIGVGEGLGIKAKNCVSTEGSGAGISAAYAVASQAAALHYHGRSVADANLEQTYAITLAKEQKKRGKK